MENTQNTKTAKELGQKAATSDDLTLSPKQETTAKGASKSSRSRTTATTLRGFKATWTSAELEASRLKAGLVAGALADFQTAGGLVVVKNMEYEGGKFVKFFLVADNTDLVAAITADGIDFAITPRLVAEVKK